MFINFVSGICLSYNASQPSSVVSHVEYHNHSLANIHWPTMESVNQFFLPSMYLTSIVMCSHILHVCDQSLLSPIGKEI